jgi:DNA-directed RNA polymerase subunit RPC12/RpoP
VTIEFCCFHCNKLLSTSDEKAGRQAKCPGCGQRIEVPASGKPLPDHDLSDHDLPDDRLVDDDLPEVNLGDRADTLDDSADPTDFVWSAPEQTCPACGERMAKSAIRCFRCGKIFDDDGTGSRRRVRRCEIRPFPPDEVIADAWRFFTQQAGLLILAFVVFSFLVMMAWTFCASLRVLAEALLNQGGWLPSAIAVVLLLVSWLGLMSLYSWLEAGYVRLQLNVVREQPAKLQDLFSGGPFFLRMLVVSSIFGLMISFGLSFCLIPGLFVALIFWPCCHVLVDEDLSVWQSLVRAKELTDGNWGSLILIFMFAAALAIAGVCTCGIGLTIALPFNNLLYVVTHDRMTGQTRRHRDVQTEN